MASPKCCLSAAGSFKHLVSILVFGMFSAFSKGENEVGLSFWESKALQMLSSMFQHENHADA